MRLHLSMMLCLLAPIAASAQETDLTEMSLADLLNVEVTSVSRKPQPLSRTAAAVHVITQEDIRRSGARTIADLLRMAPGFSVAQIDSNSWAVGSRGFSGLYARQLLVLIDGRSVYTPLFGGVHWEMQNLLPEDIERIEVIRGPGGTLWGANAVNGVVNIITKTAATTRGGLVRARTAGPRGTEGDARYGAALGDRVDFRVFGRAIRRESAAFAGIESPDRGAIETGGGRVDWRRSEIETLSVQAFVQQGRITRILGTAAGLIESPGAFEQSNVVVSWARTPSGRSDSGVQFYFDGYSQGNVSRSRIADVDARHRHALGRRHEVVVGAGFRSELNVEPGYTPERERSHVVHAFVQDEIELAKGLYLTPGSKFEHNEYTGFEIQPSLRALWRPAARHTLWAAVSRAVRTPSRVNRGAHLLVNAALPTGFPLRVELNGNPAMESERLRGLEAGYRVQFRTASVDVVAFRNAYDRLQSAEPDFSLPAEPGLLRLRIGNGLEGKTAGVEIAGTWVPMSHVRLVGTYTRLALEVLNSPGSLDFLGIASESSSAPRQQAHGRAYMDLPARFEVSALAWRVGSIEGVPVEAYTRLDLNLGWRANRSLDLAIGVQNLLRNDAVEFFDISGTQALPRKVHVIGELTWRF